MDQHASVCEWILCLLLIITTQLLHGSIQKLCICISVQSQKTLKASHEAAMVKVDELTSQLKEERLRSLGMESQLHTKTLVERRTNEVIWDLDYYHLIILFSDGG